MAPDIERSVKCTPKSKVFQFAHPFFFGRVFTFFVAPMYWIVMFEFNKNDSYIR